MKKVLKFVKGKKEERKEGGGMTPSQSGELLSPPQTPEDEGFLAPENSTGYAVDFGGKDKTLTKLHKAAWQGNLEKLKSALKKVEVDAVDKRNRTALHLAVAQGHPNIVWFLLGNNAKTSIADDDGRTPLLKAIECGHRDCTTLLLDRGANVNASDYAGNTGLHLAVERLSLDTVAALLGKGADAELANNAGDCPLHVATKLENKDLVLVLLDAGASVDVPDRENRTPLMLAAKTGNSLLTKIFVERGAQLSIADSNGWTAHDYAMLGGHENVSASLKTLARNAERSAGPKSEESDGGSWGDSQTETSDKEPITEKLKKMFEKCSEEEGEGEEEAAKEKSEDLSESPDADAIPPYCQPPRSWEMIQAGMIDENNGGVEGKRRSITALGTLRSRRESFTEASASASASSPQFTLSLNRRRSAKGSNNEFARQRFSFNEEESLKYWSREEKGVGKDSETNLPTLEGARDAERGRSASESEWDSASEEKSHSQGKAREGWRGGETEGEQEESGGRSEGGTLGRMGTMREVEEIWVSPAGAEEKEQNNSWDSEKEGSFPPPPTALELGVDMARSIKYMKGMSVDRPPGCAADRNLWKNVRERHSLDCVEERDLMEIPKGAKANGKPSAVQKGEEIFRSLKPTDRFADVNKRINQELECYDQALRELAESSRFPSQNFHSLPSIKTGGGGECRRANSQDLASDASRRPGGPNSLPLLTATRGDVEEEMRGSGVAAAKAEEKTEKKSKRHMLLAMRDVKHAVRVANSFKTSLDDQILSPLAKPEEDLDSADEMTSPSALPRSSGGESPADENPFFGIGRQETVLERNGSRRKGSSSSGTGEESTLWLQEEGEGGKKGLRCPDSDEEVSEMGGDEGWKHRRTSSFSPLGLLHKEMEEESRGTKTSDDVTRGENEERREEIFREQSPDVSLSSGPIEPIGAEKDSGSEPESSHNDVSPTHHYAVRNQHEWLKSHLKAATTEKSKLEELTAQLTEKAERLQYELADAREAAKSRDEVIRLLQGQLARMEAAYTKSLEESVQSRLQLTSHEQEILHLKELCFKYEEEKEAAEAGARGDFLEELKSKVKMLEEEKEKMREEMCRLEEEKCLLEKRLKRGKKEEAEMMEECQRWKERCQKLEEMTKAHESRGNADEAGRTEREDLRQLHFQLEKKCLELNKENVQLKGKVERLSVELEFERRKAKEAKEAEEEKEESISQVKRKTVDMEIKLKKLESEVEENLLKRLKEKEGEVEGLVRQFDRERDSLVAAYECRLKEGKAEEGRSDGDDRRLKQAVESLKDQMLLEQKRMSASVESAHEALRKELRRLKGEWDSASKGMAEAQKDFRKGKSGRGGEGGVFDHDDVRSEILDLKTQVQCLRELLDREEKQKTSERKSGERGEGRRRDVGKENELAWSSLYGMKRTGRRGRKGKWGKGGDVEESSDENVEETKKRKSSEGSGLNRLNVPLEEGKEESEKCQKLEFLELKKEILSLQSRMLDEKNLRHALENQMIKMNLDLSTKDNLEKEVNSLKRKVDREYLRTSEMELIQYEKDLEAKREKYLGVRGEGENEDFKAKCQILAKEREKSKQIRESFGRKAKSFDCPPLEGPPHPKVHSCPRPLPELLLHPRLVSLDPELKQKLEMKLDKSIRKYVQGTSSAAVTPVQLGLFERKNF